MCHAGWAVKQRRLAARVNPSPVVGWAADAQLGMEKKKKAQAGELNSDLARLVSQTSQAQASFQLVAKMSRAEPS